MAPYLNCSDVFKYTIFELYLILNISSEQP